jgi:protease-4
MAVAIKRGLGLVFALLGVALLISIAGIVLMFLLVGREPTVASGSTLILNVQDDLNEIPPPYALGGVVGLRAPTLRALVDNLRKAKVDARIAAVLVKPTNLSSAYWAKLQEVHDAIADYRRSGKPAMAFLEYGGTSEYYVATACDRIYMVPTSPLDLTGLASYTLFLRGTLDKIGAYPDFLRIGDYKTAPNQLTEKTFTPAHREMSESLNGDFFDQLVQAIAEGRKKDASQIRTLIDNGPFLPDEALSEGLIDDLMYEDQALTKLPSGPARTIASDEYARIDSASLGLGGKTRLAVIYAVGLITSGKSGFDPLNGSIIGSDTLVEYIRRVRKDSSIKAVVLRIDSPGGSSVASDVIWRELKMLGDAKPLVASMSDLAASGGYYIAVAAPDIVAQPGTLTGSIGIYGGKVVTKGTYEKLGMNVDVVSTGRHAEMNSPVRPFTDEERRRFGDELEAFYEQFVEKVAEARRMKPEDVDAIAQGRVWTGRQARKLGLVDALGGLDRAIALAKQRAKIPAGEGVELVVYPPKKSVYELLTESFSAMDERAAIAALLGINDRRAVSLLTAPLRVFRAGEPLALMPMAFVR